MSLRAKAINRTSSFPQGTPDIKTRATAEAWTKKRHSYKPLPIQFLHDGFNYRQIARKGDAAIYEQTWSGCCNPSVCYEVIHIRTRDGFQIGARFVEPAEVYPTCLLASLLRGVVCNQLAASRNNLLVAEPRFRARA
jgi:hypothetical protein